MAGPVEFYFDYSSPYGYLAAHKIEDVAAEHEREVAWRPFMLGVVMKTTRAEPLLNVPIKGDYARRDVARSARLCEIPFTVPESFPFPSIAACRATYWLAGSDPRAAVALAKALYDRAFADGKSIREPGEVVAVAGELGHDPAAVNAALQDPDVKAQLKREMDAALAKGVFGSPYFIVDGEPFWGYDRLKDVSLWLKTGGW